MRPTNRRTFLITTCAATLAPGVWAEDLALIEPSELAGILNDPEKRPVVISVAFPVLYRQRHIPNARFAGPGNKPEGISALKQAVAELPKDARIVIYCGCCPMVRCPNVRPAYAALTGLGYTNVRVLNVPTNFRTDWTDKGYSVDPPAAS